MAFESIIVLEGFGKTCVGGELNFDSPIVCSKLNVALSFRVPRVV